MKNSLCVLITSLMLFCTVTACNTTGSYKTIDSTATIVINANSVYLQGVVSGQIPTNNVPRVELAFNDTMMALKLAATVSSAGAKAPATPVLQTKAKAFVTYVNSQKPKKAKKVKK